MNVPVIALSSVQFLAVACVGVLLGTVVKHRLPIFDKLNVPAPILGGLIYAVVLLIMRDRILNVEFDTVLQPILMVAFFTSMGMGASLGLIKRGGMQVLIFFGVASAGALLQNLAGIGMAKVLGVSPLLGIVTGSVALTGGPATALAFGKTFETEYGVAGAGVVGFAAAVVGITAGGLLGGFLGGSIIKRRGLKSGIVGLQRDHEPDAAFEATSYTAEASTAQATPERYESEDEENALLRNVLVIGIAMGVGTLVKQMLDRAGFAMPEYIGAMVIAAILRNVDDKLGWFKIEQHRVDAIGNVALQIFIVMALMNLKLWTLVDLAGPLVLMLIGQIILVVLMVVLLVFTVMGRDYEAAVMAGGFTGFMLGTTANAMACMDVLVKKHGPAPRAYIVVPIVGCFLIDFTNAMFINGLANVFK